MKPLNFYLYVTAIGKMGQPPLELQCGPYGSLEEARTKFTGLAREPGYEYSARIDQGPDSTQPLPCRACLVALPCYASV